MQESVLRLRKCVKPVDPDRSPTGASGERNAAITTLIRGKETAKQGIIGLKGLLRLVVAGRAKVNKAIKVWSKLLPLTYS